jgi:hypothetical protein
VGDGPSSTKECRRWPIDRLRGATFRALKAVKDPQQGREH